MTKAAKAASKPSSPADWRRSLQTTAIKDGSGGVTGWKIQPNTFNVSLIFTFHSAWQGLLVYNEFAERIDKTRAVPGVKQLGNKSSKAGPWTDADTEAARVWLQGSENVSVGSADVIAAVTHAARHNSKHPVREYLKQIKWDKRPRIDTALSEFFGVEDTPYSRGISRCWFISAIARVMVPGCQADYALIFESPQGWKKNRALRHLVPVAEWFADTGITLGAKDSYQNLHGVWIYCLDEMASVHGAEVKTMRGFMTGTVDRYRKSYGHFAEAVPRQNVFCCTINPEAGGYFADRTGNRRFWPLKMLKQANADGITKFRDQLWAEAKALYDKKVQWWPDEKLLALCEAQQAKRTQIEPWNELIGQWLLDGCPKRGDDNCFIHPVQRFPIARGISTSEVMRHCLGIRPHEMAKGHAMRAAQCLKDLDFNQDPIRETHDGVRDRYYKPGAPALKTVAASSTIKTPKKVGQLSSISNGNDDASN